MAAHGADTHAQAVDWDFLGAKVDAAAQDLVRFRARLPLFLRLAVAQVLVDPRNQVAGQRRAELLDFIRGIAVLGGQHLAVDFQDGGSGVVQQRLDGAVDGAKLRQQFAHVLRAAARGRLVCHRRHPVDQIVLEQAAQAHHHARDGAIAADVVLDALAQRILDDVQVDGVEHDDGVFFHAQGRGRIDPVAIPARCAQLREDGARVVAALAGNDDVALGQFGDVVGILEDGFILRHGRRRAARVRRREKHRFDVGEIALFLHALHQDRTDHTAPTYQAN